MKKIIRGAGSILLAAALSILVCSTAAFAAESENPGIKIPVTMKLSGSVPSKAEELTVVLTAKDASCPMPEGTEDGICRLTVIGAGVKEFPEITFTKTGVHEYTIHQEKGSHSRGRYDDSVYHMTIYVTNAEIGGLEATALVYMEGNESKQGAVTFENSYRRSGGGGSSDRDPIRETDPGTIIDPDEVPLAGDSGSPDTIVLDEIGDPDIPLAIFPATGDETVIWLYVVLLAVGIVGFAVTLFRKETRE